MRLASRCGVILTILAIGAIAAPSAHAGGLLSTGHDPKGADRQEAQSFLRIYSHPASTPSFHTLTSGAPSSSFDYADAAIGAGAMAGLVLLGTAGTLVVRRHGHLRHQ
jgi:hypothetical protein